MKQKPKRKKKIISSKRLPPSKIPVGISARDIKKGEIISFNPYGNTKDILIEKEPSGAEVAKAIKVLQAHIRAEHSKGSVCITTAIITTLKEAN